MAALAAALALPVVAATACDGDGTFGLTPQVENNATFELWRALAVDGLVPDTVPGVSDGRFGYGRQRDTVAIGWVIGCNRVGVRFVARDDSLRYVDSGGTRRGCPDRLAALDARIAAALAASRRYVRSDSLVNVLDASGSTRLSFRVLPDTLQPYGAPSAIASQP